MKQKLITGLIMMAVLLQFGLGRDYELQEFLKDVRANSKVLRLAEKDRESAVVQKREARAGALPQVGLQAGYNRNLSKYYMYFDMSALTGGSAMVSKVPIKRDNEFSASIGLSQTLFSSSVLYAVRASRQYEKLVDQIYSSSEHAVVTAAKKLFFQGILLKRIVEISRKTEKNALDNYQDVKLKYDNGQVSEFELLRAETRWRSAVPETRQAERNFNLLKNNLKNLAGLDSKEKINLRGSLVHAPELPEKRKLEKVLENRPDYNVLNWQRRLGETQVKAAKGSFLPELKASVALAYSAQSDKFRLDEENRLWVAGLSLSCPLYTGGYRRAQVMKARISLEKTRIQLKKKREDICTELDDVYLKLSEAKSRRESAQLTLKVAGKAFSIAEVTTRNGLTTQLDLKDARVAFDKATLGFYAAQYDYLDAYFDWEKIVGSPD